MRSLRFPVTCSEVKHISAFSYSSRAGYERVVSEWWRGVGQLNLKLKLKSFPPPNLRKIRPTRMSAFVNLSLHGVSASGLACKILRSFRNCGWNSVRRLRREVVKCAPDSADCKMLRSFYHIRWNFARRVINNVLNMRLLRGSREQCVVFTSYNKTSQSVLQYA